MMKSLYTLFLSYLTGCIAPQAGKVARDIGCEFLLCAPVLDKLISSPLCAFGAKLPAKLGKKSSEWNEGFATHKRAKGLDMEKIAQAGDAVGQELEIASLFSPTG
jgi:hypothetical protein